MLAAGPAGWRLIPAGALILVGPFNVDGPLVYGEENLRHVSSLTLPNGLALPALASIAIAPTGLSRGRHKPARSSSRPIRPAI